MNELERTFLNLATERGLLSPDTRDQVEAACARAAGEGQSLRPWRAAFVRGLLTRAEVDQLLKKASEEVEASGTGESAEEALELRESAEDEGLDYRLGVLAVQTGVLDEDQLAKGLAAKRARPGKKSPPLGEVLVAEGLLSKSVLEGLMLLQDRLREQDGRTNSSTEAIAADLRFGQVALDARLVAEKDLERALAEQARRKAAGGGAKKGPSLFVGDILVEQGGLTREGRDLLLELQERRSTRPVTPIPVSRATPDEVDRLGRMLVESRLVSETAVSAGLQLQRELRAKGIDRRLGDLLVLQGVVDRPTLETVLRAQSVRRRQPPVKRRRLLRGESLDEHPLTVLLAAVLACGLTAGYLGVTDGLGLVLRALAARRSGHETPPRDPPRDR